MYALFPTVTHVWFATLAACVELTPHPSDKTAVVYPDIIERVDSFSGNIKNLPVTGHDEEGEGEGVEDRSQEKGHIRTNFAIYWTPAALRTMAPVTGRTKVYPGPFPIPDGWSIQQLSHPDPHKCANTRSSPVGRFGSLSHP